MSRDFVEYTYYLDSHNAEKKLITANMPNTNSTNDVIIPCRFPNRINVAQVTLGSLELPLTQYTIEQNWQQLYFDEGIDLYVMDAQSESLVQFSIDENGTTYTAQLPPRLNPIIDISPLSSTNTAIFTTQYPHMLSLRGLFNWGEPMKLISTPLTDPDYTAFTDLNTTNVGLVILSDTEFQLTWSGAAVTFNTNTVLGYVSTPSIPSPSYLAALVTASMNLVAPNHWVITYDPCVGKYNVCYTGSLCNVQDLNPTTLLVPGTNSLPSIMGFGCTNVNISISSNALTNQNEIIPKQRNLDNIPVNCIQSIDCSPCRSQINIDIGNYTPENLMSNLSRQLNRFYFDPGCNMSATAVHIVFSTQCGGCSTVTIPFGMFSPDTLAAFLQSAMATDVPGIDVSWNINTGQFTFTAPSDFGLEFDAGTTDLAFRLGFYPISYRNNNSYQSTIPIYYPTKGCCGTTIPDRHLSYVYTPLVNGSQRKFIVEVCKPRTYSSTAITYFDNHDGTMNVTYTTPAFGHGFQVLDVVEFAVTPFISPITYYMVVTNVVSYNEFTVDLGSVPFSVFNGGMAPLTYNCFSLENTISTNLYFSCVGNNVMARTLGYTECDALWNVSQPTTWIAPACYMLDWPQYLLVDLSEPNGATHNLHAWKDDPNHTDTNTRVLAKVILYPQYRMERSFPFHMVLPDLRIINRVQVRLLNPDHSLYQLHGRDWSMTLSFHAVEKSINQLCY